MKELFQKLSNLFSFGKEARLTNVETPDNSGPDDSNIDPLEVPLGQEKPDMSGPELVGEYTEKEASKLESEFKRKAPVKIAKADTGLKKLEKNWDVVKEGVKMPFITDQELTDEEKQILDFEKPGGKTILPKQAEYLRVERVEASKGEEVKPEIPDLVPIGPDIKYTFKVPVGLDISDEVVEKALNKLVLSKRSEDMGYTPKEMKDYMEHLKPETIKGLAQTAISLENKGMGYQVEELAEDLNSDMRDYEKYKTSKGYKYDEEGMNNLIASYTETPEEMPPIADEERPIELSDEMVAELTGGFEGDEEWGEEKPGPTPAEEVEKLRQEILAKKTRIAGGRERKEPPTKPR